MLNLFIDTSEPLMAFAGLFLAFVGTCVGINLFFNQLPRDLGREYAHDGKLSAGKPRGAGIIFVISFLITALFFANITTENLIYLLLIFMTMITGFLDDASKSPWGEYKKGLLDLIIAIALTVTYIYFNSTRIVIMVAGVNCKLNPVVFGILAVILIWVSINVTNCADGVDGLSGTLTIITLYTLYTFIRLMHSASTFGYLILLFCVSILAYLWYNATPSKLMMGDAGSRAMGVFIAIAVLKSGAPLIYIPVAFVLIVDGGLGLIKVFLLRFFKIHILKNTRTPIHDHVRKEKGWSNTHTVFRFAIIQLVISMAIIYFTVYRIGTF